MSTLKLYNEQQVKEMLSMTDMVVDGELLTHIDIISSQTPIELPSDEEIEKHSRLYGIGFPLIKIGALWMREQILNQNK